MVDAWGGATDVNSLGGKRLKQWAQYVLKKCPARLTSVPKLIPENQGVTVKERFRFSRLYLPGNSPRLMINAGIHKPNGLILDLEDSVAPSKKEEARFLVRNALRQLNFYGAERMVRINQLPEGLSDLEFIIPHNVQVILVPKCEDAQQIRDLEMEIDVIKKSARQDNQIFLMPILEIFVISPLGMFCIRCQSKRQTIPNKVWKHTTMNWIPVKNLTKI